MSKQEIHDITIALSSNNRTIFLIIHIMETVLYSNGRMGKVPFVTSERIELKGDGFYTQIDNTVFKYIHGMWMEV